jgi:hypothetical protein
VRLEHLSVAEMANYLVASRGPRLVGRTEPLSAAKLVRLQAAWSGKHLVARWAAMMVAAMGHQWAGKLAAWRALSWAVWSA